MAPEISKNNSEDYKDLFQDEGLESMPNMGERINKVEVTIGGKKITADIYRVDLIQRIDSHHELKVVIRKLGMESEEQGFSDIDDYSGFIGQSISLKSESVVTGLRANKEMSFVGVVTRVEFKNSIDGINITVIYAHSPTILLDGGPRNKFFFDQKASDIISAVLGDYSITKGTAESTSTQMKYCVQYRETDYDFIMRLATGESLYAFYNGKEFCVQKANQSGGVTLAYPHVLGGFVYGMGTRSPNFESAVYNYEQKKTFAGDSTSLPLERSANQMSKKSTDASKDLYSKLGFTETPKFIEDAQGLDQVLKRERGGAMGKMVICRGVSVQPEVSVGKAILVERMAKLDGAYWVTSVHHLWAEGGYRNRFECIPVDLAYPRYQSRRAAVTNLQPAVVIENNDPDKLGRVKLSFPWMEAAESPWVRVVYGAAGSDHGFIMIPEVDDEVLVGYEQGDPDFPVVIGAVYNGVDKPNDITGGDKNNVKVWYSRSGHFILFDDTDGTEQIAIVSKDGSKIILDAQRETIDIFSSGTINVKGTDIKYEASSFTLEADGNIKIKAGGNLDLEASGNIKSKAGGNHDTQGTMVNVKGNPINLN